MGESRGVAEQVPGIDWADVELGFWNLRDVLDERNDLVSFSIINRENTSLFIWVNTVDN